MAQEHKGKHPFYPSIRFIRVRGIYCPRGLPRGPIMCAMPDAAALARLVSRLETALAALAAEARNYPGPIARCDDQLPALLEKRARTAEALHAARHLQELLAGLDPP